MILNLEQVKPRVYQSPVIETVKKALLTRDEVLFVMAMGLGKTVVSAFVVEDRLRSGQRGLFLCHETYILGQVEQEYKKIIGEDLVCKTFYGQNKKDWTADNADMLFASFQSLNNWHEQWFLAFDRDHFDFMVIDESHHGQAPSYKEVIDYFQCKKIAMTATPDRMDLKNIREMFGEEVYTITLEEGIANGWLANVEYHIVSDGINNRKLQKICKDVLEDGKRVSIRQLNETIFISERDKAEKEVINEYTKIKEYSNNKKTLLFCERTIHADNLIQHFANSGVMHSKKSVTENDAVFNEFKDDKLQYVASVNKFNEGKHVPGVEVIVFLRATDSLTIFWQQLGRALAKEWGVEKKVIVLDFVSNLERLVMIRDMMLKVKEIQDTLEFERPEKLPLDKNPLNVTGEGFEFIFSDELIDVMKVIEALRKGFYDTWEEASKAARGMGIRDSAEYKKNYKKDLRLPSNPNSVYVNFPTWAVFLEYQIPKEGWVNSRKLGLILNSAHKTISAFAEEFRTTHPEWFDYCDAGNGKHAVFYHPELIVLIKEKFKKIPKIQDWVTLTELLTLLKRRKAGLVPIINSLRANNLTHIAVFWDEGISLPSEQYHPDFVEKIKIELLQQERPEPGWESTSSLAKKKDLIISTEKIVEFVSQFKKSRPQWFKKFYVAGNVKFAYFFHPELVKKIYDTYGDDKRLKAPPGWLTPNSLGKDKTLTVKASSIKKYAEQFRQSDPEWFKIFWFGSGFFEHYHPDLVKKIRTEFGNRKICPRGWFSANYFEETGFKKAYKIKEYVEQFRDTKPHWFKFYLNKTVYGENYHPDLIKKIKVHFAKKKGR